MKTRRELILHYWGFIHDMVNAYNAKYGTNIKPYNCVKCNGTVDTNFPNIFKEYAFAVAIVEDKPVFPGDTIYHVITGNQHNWDIEWTDTWRHWTWAKSSTFMLNDIELPCPTSKATGYYVMCIGSEIFSFNTEVERDKVLHTLQDILKGEIK